MVHLLPWQTDLGFIVYHFSMRQVGIADVVTKIHVQAREKQWKINKISRSVRITHAGSLGVGLGLRGLGAVVGGRG